MCVFMLSSRLSLWSHSLHLKSFSLLCKHLMCLISFSLFARNFPHSPHSTPIASFSSSDNLQILSWLFIHGNLKFNPQLEHGWCLFSPCTYFVWTFSYPLDASHLEQMLQINLNFFVGGFGFLIHPGAWVLMCRFNLYLSICFLLHKLQTRDDPIRMKTEWNIIKHSHAGKESKSFIRHQHQHCMPDRQRHILHANLPKCCLFFRGCSLITSANIRGSWTPPPPSVSNGQHLAYPPSPFSSAFVSISPAPLLYYNFLRRLVYMTKWRTFMS